MEKTKSSSVPLNDHSVRSLVLIAAFTALVIVGAVFSFPSPWNPAVPFTLATLFIILSGLLLGPWRAAAVAGLYLLLGAAGLPVFSEGKGGIQILAGPTGGFLVGYLLAAFSAGLITRAGRGRTAFLVLAALTGTLVIYVPGLPWLHWSLTGSLENLSASWVKYAVPFLIGDLVKAVAAVTLTRVLQNRIR